MQLILNLIETGDQTYMGKNGYNNEYQNIIFYSTTAYSDFPHKFRISNQNKKRR